MVDGQRLESTLTRSASATIDDLTLALANFSRVPSPEPPSAVVCCCGKDDCENTRSWLDIKSKLESRLVLSAEVGQALLQRHEAYVRRQESEHDDPLSRSTQTIRSDDRYSVHEPAESLVDDLMREKAALEKRLNQALVNNEVGEASHKTLLQELQEARTAISRLTAQNARSAGWDVRLTGIMQERDDMQQERDSEAHRARQAETRIAALNNRVAKLQSEVQSLREGVEQRRLHRLESSESILQEARSRLEALQNSQIGHTAMTEANELTMVLHSLVDEDENLKRDNADLQRLLAESREDYNILQEEVEEQRVNSQYRSVPQYRSLFLTSSALNSPSRRNTSSERRFRRNFEPLTPETDCLPLSPSMSLTPSDTNLAPIHSRPQPIISSLAFEMDDEFLSLHPEASQPHKPQPLSRSRGVQTDLWPGVLGLSAHQIPISPTDIKSETSSFMDSPMSSITVMIERIALLLNKMIQTDALTLMNRLKRQNLKGADLGHLSRVTVGNIVSEAGSLRAEFRHLLEDDKMITICTRKDLRGLFKLFRDSFTEMGKLRVTLNDVILDPSIAGKLREMALNLSKAETAAPSGQSSSGGWMTPISKLFGSSASENSGTSHEVSSHSKEDGRGRARSRAPHRVIPKLGPALSASTTTVNVEFSAGGLGRSVTSTIKARGDSTVRPPGAASGGTSRHTSTNVMGIFAGAPQASPQDSWVVLPKPRPGARPLTRSNNVSAMPSSSEAKNPMNDRKTNRFSRNVDAIIDVPSAIDDESEPVAPLLHRTLRRRGLSDSSIHSTFLSQADDSRLPPHATMGDGPSARETVPDKRSVLKALSRTVQNFRFATSSYQPPVISGNTSSVDAIQPQAVGEVSQATHPTAPSIRTSSPLAAIIPSIPSWAAVSATMDMDAGEDSFYVGSTKEESLLNGVR